MKTAKSYLFMLLLLLSNLSFSQNTFDYQVALTPIQVPGLPGLHSYAFGQHNDKWLVIGGRKDGLHARQPFNAFPASQSNTDLYVIDVTAQAFWTASLNTLPTAIAEHLQATNMNFLQAEDTLYIIGGYAFSATANDHVTFPNLTTVQVPALIDAIIQGSAIQPFFKQITDTAFAVTGGQLGKIGDTFYLVGGQKFEGRYNPMGHPTYTQTYTNAIRTFTIDNSGSQLSFSDYTTISDPVHLRRRDYNLLPQIFPDGTRGYTISSGVFQMNVDLPFLYPVDITPNGYTPITTFNQYFSNYHSAKVAMYDSLNNRMHSLFFGGMSQYYSQNGVLTKDDKVPFVKTISLLTRLADSSLHEYQLPTEMPALAGASAEFILNPQLAFEEEILMLNKLPQDTVTIGHILGGIMSPSLNPFSVNQTNQTRADPTIYAVQLVHSPTMGLSEIRGLHTFDFKLYPNPAEYEIHLAYQLASPMKVTYFISNENREILAQGEFPPLSAGDQHQIILLDPTVPPQLLSITLIADYKFFTSKKFIKK